LVFNDSSWNFNTFEVRITRDLARAAFAGTEAIVDVLLSQGMNANRVNSLSSTPLSWAVQSGYERIV
jgi:ankyrin repeat protein